MQGLHCCWARTALLAWCMIGAARADEWFGPYASVADYRPKGPSHCFRQFNIDWSWIALRPEQIPEFLSQADPAALAEFCRQSNVDGIVVMAVPHHGYCTYETRVGAKFPGMQGDWFGRTIDELHKRRIAAFGYVTLNWNWKFLRENLGRDFVHGKPDAQGVFTSHGTLCLNAPGYLELVEAYTREVLERYPVDGMRWDILVTAKRCLCSGCKQLYWQTYGEELIGWNRGDPNRATDFYMVTTDRVVNRLHALCKRIKPSVEIWQNCIQSNHPTRLDTGRSLDVAYNEYSDPFRLLFIRGATNKAAAINGLMNKAPTDPPIAIDRQAWRTCLALGGRCYSYYGHKQTDHRTLLPNGTFHQWHRRELAPFYQMVSQIEPWLEGALPVSHVGVVFSERTRFRFANYDRKEYIAPLEAITNAMLERNVAIEFVNCLDLGDPRKRIDRFKTLVLPLTSGLTPAELACVRRYVEQGGTLLVIGDALRHDEKGRPLADFALARELGVSYVGAAVAAPPVKRLTLVRATAGQTLEAAKLDGVSHPLLHENKLGQGRCVYLGSLDAVDFIVQTIERLAGQPPACVVGAPEKRVALTHQPDKNRWILHLLSDGDYWLTINTASVPATRVTAHYPAVGWAHRIERTEAGLRIEVKGPAPDRLLVLE